jgi:hypothetical protein
MAVRRIAVDFRRGPATHRPVAWVIVIAAAMFLGAEIGALIVAAALR